jgi:hypothetical protein
VCFACAGGAVDIDGVKPLNFLSGRARDFGEQFIGEKVMVGDNIMIKDAMRIEFIEGEAELGDRRRS